LGRSEWRLPLSLGEDKWGLQQARGLSWGGGQLFGRCSGQLLGASPLPAPRWPGPIVPACPPPSPCSGWGFKAQQTLGQVRGKDFRHEKTKKKRGSYRWVRAGREGGGGVGGGRLLQVY
jgi:hypothetical protein